MAPMLIMEMSAEIAILFLDFWVPFIASRQGAERVTDCHSHMQHAAESPLQPSPCFLMAALCVGRCEIRVARPTKMAGQPIYAKIENDLLLLY